MKKTKTERQRHKDRETQIHNNAGKGQLEVMDIEVKINKEDSK